jgi:hypothetical protein
MSHLWQAATGQRLPLQKAGYRPRDPTPQGSVIDVVNAAPDRYGAGFRKSSGGASDARIASSTGEPGPTDRASLEIITGRIEGDAEQSKVFAVVRDQGGRAKQHVQAITTKRARPCALFVARVREQSPVHYRLQKARLQASRVMMWSMTISKPSMTTKRKAEAAGTITVDSA